MKRISTFVALLVASALVCLGQWEAVLSGSVTSAPAAPAFVADIDNWNAVGSATVNQTLTLNSGHTIPSGVRAVLLVAGWTTGTADSMTDSQGNTWTLDKATFVIDAGVNHMAIFSCASVVTPVVGSNGDYVRVTFSAAPTSGVQITAHVLTASGTTSLDSTGSKTDSGSFNTTTSAATVSFALISLYPTSATVSGSTWTQVTPAQSNGNTKDFYFYYNSASAGTVNPGVTSGDAGVIGGISVSYK